MTEILAIMPRSSKQATPPSLQTSGRRRQATPACVSLLVLLVLTALFSQLARSCHGAVFTVDYGSEWIKVAVVSPRLKPDPIAIAINEMSKRKSPALVAISNGDRLVSEEAAGIAARYPDRVYFGARDLIGVPLEEAKALLAKHYAGFTVTDRSPPRPQADSGEGEGTAGGKEEAVEAATGKAWITTHDGKTQYMAEEIVAMLLEYARHLAELQARFAVPDAVVSVPAFFSQAQRQALLDAASLVGVNVMALVQEHSGVALQYGMFRAKELEEDRHVVIYDCGASSTYAAVIFYSKYTVKERGKNVTQPQFQVKAVRWDESFGGQSLELRLVEHFADEFNAQMNKGKGSKGTFDVRALPKSMAKLRKQVKRTKEVLSANTEAPISVESLFEENDFRSSITRDKFEQLCADLWPRAVEPLRQAVADAGLTVDQLHAVELVGGSTRVPRIQAALQDFLGPNKTLDRHLDADEALALGASWLAANLSDGFKLSRRVGMVDGVAFGVQFQVVALPGAAEGAVAETTENLFPRLKKFPLKIIKSLKQHAADDFELSLQYDAAEGLPPTWPKQNPPIATFHITGAKNATEKYSSYNLTAPLKTTLHFSLSRSAIVNLDKAEVVVEFSEWYEVKVPIIPPPTANATNATNTTAGANSSSSTTASAEAGVAAGEAGAEAGGGAAEGEAAEEQGKKDGESEGAAGGSSEGGEEAGGSTGNGSTDGKGNGEKGNATAAEEPKYEVKQKLRKRTIRIPLKIVDATEGFQRLMTDEEADAAEKRLEELRVRDAEKKATAEAKNALEAYIYSTKDKLESVDDLSKVSTEDQRDSVRAQLNDAEDWLYMDGENAGAKEFKRKLTEIRKDADAIFFRHKEVTERPAAVESARSTIDFQREKMDLWKETKPWINETLIAALADKIDEFEKWLSEKEAEQRKTPPHEEPAFTSTAVRNRLDQLMDKFERLERTPKPRPKKPPPPKPSAKDNDTVSGNDTSSATGKDDSTQAAEEGDGKDDAAKDEL